MRVAAIRHRIEAEHVAAPQKVQHVLVAIFGRPHELELARLHQIDAACTRLLVDEDMVLGHVQQRKRCDARWGQVAPCGADEAVIYPASGMSKQESKDLAEAFKKACGGGADIVAPHYEVAQHIIKAIGKVGARQ